MTSLTNHIQETKSSLRDGATFGHARRQIEGGVRKFVISRITS